MKIARELLTGYRKLTFILDHSPPVGRYIQTVIMMGFFMFFQDLCEFVIHCNKRHIFLCSVCLFFLLTITGRNEAIIVELKK